MESHTRSSHSRCLVCYKNCDTGAPLIDGDIVGAVNCFSLQRQLQNYFVARHLLDIPIPWCESHLGKLDGDCNPESWFSLCDKCLMIVTEAWNVHQRILQLESKLKGIKENIKVEMVRGIKASKRRGRLKSVGIDNDIRTLLHPDLMTKNSQKTKTEATEGDDEDSFSPHDFDDFDDILFVGTDGFEKKSRTSPKKKNKKTKPKRLNVAFHWKLCEQCPARFSDDYEYEAHLEAHEEVKRTGGMHVCQICAFPARSNGELDIHMNHKHINKKKSERKDYNCPKCDFKTQVWKQLKSHVESEHPDLPEDQIAELDLDLKCSACLKMFETKSTLVLHQRKMHSEMFGVETTSLQCSYCSMMFPNSIRLKYHISSEHFRINKFVCDDCGKGFAFLKHLERHKTSHQKGKKEYVCHICGCDYAYISILHEHYRKFHPERGNGGTKKEDDGTGAASSSHQEEFSCKYCDMKTPFKTVLIRHMQTHKAEMGFQCEICSKYYTNAQGLKRHKAINHSNTKVQCPYCFKTFPHADYMKSHIRLYCKMKDLNEKSNGPTKEDVQEDATGGGDGDVETGDHDQIVISNNIHIPNIEQNTMNFQEPQSSTITFAHQTEQIPIQILHHQPFEITVPKGVKMEVIEVNTDFLSGSHVPS